MIGKTISHYPPKADLLQRRMSLWLKPLADKILDKIGKASLHLSYGWQGGPVRRFILRNFSEGGSHLGIGEIKYDR